MVILAILTGFASCQERNDSFVCQQNSYPCATCDPENPHRCGSCLGGERNETLFELEHPTHSCECKDGKKF